VSEQLLRERLAQIRRVLTTGKTVHFTEQVWMLVELEQAAKEKPELERLRELEQNVYAGIEEMARESGVFNDHAGQIIDHA
jgi:hypothetical protein